MIFNQEIEPDLFNEAVAKALDEKAAWIMTWGISAEKYHDWIDDSIVWREIERPETATASEDDIVLTT